MEVEFLEVNMCVVCLNEKCDLIAIGFDDQLEPNIGPVLVKHLWFQQDDLNYKCVCEECWIQVKQFHDFYIAIEKTHNVLILEKNEFVIKTELAKIPIEEIQIIDNASITQVDMQNAEKNEQITVENIEGSGKEDILTIEEEHLEVCSEVDVSANDNSDDDSNSFDKTEMIIDKKDDSKSSDRTERIYHKSIAEIEAEDKKIVEHCKLNCDECESSFVNFSEFKRHFRELHQTRAHVVCCNRKFSKRFRLVEHVIRHRDPNAFKCTVCNKSYSNSASLNLHMANHGSPEAFVHKCDRCDRSFTKKFQLNAHQLHHISKEDKKYICTVCEKAYATTSLLNVHIRLRHQPTEEYICDICAKSFKVKAQFEKHRKEHDGLYQESRQQCKICFKWMKNASSLRKHVLRHDGEGGTHECDICGKLAPNVLALQSHISFVHKKERLYTCNLCPKAFKRQFSLMEHMTTHTGEVLYQCPFCAKTFNSSANMHAHKKKAHRQKWEDWKRRSELPFVGKIESNLRCRSDS
ncbi:transcription factor grauzone-like [Topomyia yanbarensis]|uniref:transcription factor grauzone-like n=1 Tax=Topomyia yanbarensis TaxID=2498891 RepID=UPI00273BCA47|nr:transcription factor grauzone-like [Topomyia yanbarensis]